jgi:ATP-dependent RNA helicase SUPV3L1/SUV3
MTLVARSRLPRAGLYQLLRRHAAPIQVAQLHATHPLARKGLPPSKKKKTIEKVMTEKAMGRNSRGRALSKNEPENDYTYAPPTAERLEEVDDLPTFGAKNKGVYRAFLRFVLESFDRLAKNKSIQWALFKNGTQDMANEQRSFVAAIKQAFVNADKGKTTASSNPLFYGLRKAFAEADARGLSIEIEYAFNSHLLRHHTTKQMVESQKKAADLSYPAEWFPATRALQRTIHVHVGPTNSGKTYNAMQALEKAKSGIYAGPLRLLAHEVYQRLTAKGRPCALVTGEEVRLPENTDTYYTSCTVEMTPLNRKVDVCIIDEIQMLGDSDRGSMWTTALMGVQAKEVHVCGEDRAVPLIKSLCASVGDKCVIHRYNRLTPLKTMSQPLGEWRNLRKGDAVVAFSRVTIHQLKKAIELETGRRCAVVYGSLPPEVRSQQAALFNDPNNEYDFLVASDAIGMGLNLEVKRVVFEATNKFNGITVQPLSISDIRQIGGRAGRFRSAHKEMTDKGVVPETMALTESAQMELKTGYVTTLDGSDLKAVHEAFGAEVAPIEQAYLQPPVSVIEAFSAFYPPDTPLGFILQRIRDVATISSRFKLRIKPDMIDIANAIQEFPLNIYDRVVMLASPAALGKDQEPLKILKAITRAISERRGGHILQMPEFRLELLDQNPPRGREQDYLHKLEMLNKAMTLYLWVSYRFSGVFPSQELAFVAREAVHARINEMLDTIRFDENMLGRMREARRLKAEREEHLRQERERLMWQEEKDKGEGGADEKEGEYMDAEGLEHGEVSEVINEEASELVTDYAGEEDGERPAVSREYLAHQDGGGGGKASENVHATV